MESIIVTGIRELLRIRLESFMAKSFQTATLDTLLTELSYAEIYRAADEAIKEALMSDKKTVGQALQQNAKKERHQASQKMIKTGKIQYTMTEPAANRQRLILLPRTYMREHSRYPSSGGGAAPFLPARDRQAHGSMLLGQLQRVKADATQACDVSVKFRAPLDLIV